ncbi:DUF4288 domain-containing protein [Psychrobacter sp. I-STPA10]|uniref:DUF4288 domain-containing protein n=1 Tax=Psychrobacter sp. I-STPA10 TaxID=2585769 RepID=UPI001E310F47|nr:DUF4288 domain-containing protein [Psychrobacter sp. I-STPA10]
MSKVNDEKQIYDKNKSPVGWYIGSYILRFVELNDKDNDDPERFFTIWENTIIVQAEDLSHAYDKVVANAKLMSEPYEGGLEAVPVQWRFEGITELLPIYEPLEDGAEIMYSERRRKLKTLRKIASHDKADFLFSMLGYEV